QIEKLESAGAATVQELIDKSQVALSDLETKQEQATKIVGIIARTGMAGGYEQEADSERKQADFWRWAAVLAMGGIFGFAVWMVSGVVQGPIDANVLLTKAFASLALGIIAGYAGREAGRHR